MTGIGQNAAPMPIADAEREKKYSFSTFHTLADKFVFVVQIESTIPRSKELRNTQRFQKPLNPFKEGYDKDN